LDDQIETSVTAGQITLVFRSSYLGNLTYDLDCLADLIPCSHEPAWNAEWTAEDREVLTDWRELRTRYTGDIEDRPVSPTRPPLSTPHLVRPVATGMRLAAFGARDLDDYLARLALFATAADIRTVRRVLEHFAPRGRTAWLAHRARLEATATAMATLAQDPNVVAALGAVAPFYRADIAAGGRHVLELVWRTTSGGSLSNVNLGTVATVEVHDGETVDRMFAAAMHEVFHGWFASSPLDDQVTLAMRFARSGDALAEPAYGLLDESVATALDARMIWRAIDPVGFTRAAADPNGFYDDALIDRTSKALAPELEPWVRGGKPIFDPDFAAMYLRAAHAAFPRGAPPIAYLRELACSSEPDLARATEHLTSVANPWAVFTTEDLDETPTLVQLHQAWATVLLRTPAWLSELDRQPYLDPATIALLRAQPDRAFVLTVPRTPIGVLFIFVARDNDAMTALIDAFARETELRAGVFAP